jgi:hypothetical protein
MSAIYSPNFPPLPSLTNVRFEAQALYPKNPINKRSHGIQDEYMTYGQEITYAVFVERNFSTASVRE